MHYLDYASISEQLYCRMDPRPQDFSFRRPRMENLTYLSYGASESLFHVGAYNKQFPEQRKYERHHKQSVPITGQRWNLQSVSPYNPESVTVNPLYIMHKKGNKNHQNNPISKSMVMEPIPKEISLEDKNSMSMIGNRNQKDSLSDWVSSMQNKRYRVEQDKVYETQQKSYNIINHHPRDRPDKHYQYAKYSLEDKLYEKNKPTTNLS